MRETMLNKIKETIAVFRKKMMLEASELMQLLDCPCCGGSPKIEECEVGSIKMFENNAWHIQCQKCGLELRAYEKETLINGWNQRAI